MYNKERSRDYILGKMADRRLHIIVINRPYHAFWGNREKWCQSV